jgi:hypothetical protein
MKRVAVSNTSAILFHFSSCNIQKLKMCTNFGETELVDFVQQMQPHIIIASKHGPKPKSPTVDALIYYLVWAKVGKEFDLLAKLVGMKLGRFKDNVNQI